MAMHIGLNNISGAHSAAYSSVAENRTEENAVREQFKDFKKYEGTNGRTFNLIDSVKRALITSDFKIADRYA